MNEVSRSTVVPAFPEDEPLYVSVLDHDPKWVAARRAPVLRRRSRMPAASTVVLTGAAFVAGLGVGGGSALVVPSEVAHHPRNPAVWMLPNPAIGFPAHPLPFLLPDTDPVDPALGPIESPAESTRDGLKREPGSRLRGESR